MNYIFIWKSTENKVNFIPLLGESVLYYMLKAFQGISAYKYILKKTKDTIVVEYTNNLDFSSTPQNILDLVKDSGYSVFVSEDMPLLDEANVQSILRFHNHKKNKVTLVKSKKKEIEIGHFLCLDNNYLRNIVEQENMVGLDFHTLLKYILKHKNTKYYFLKEAICLKRIKCIKDVLDAEEMLRCKIIEQHCKNDVFLQNKTSIILGPRVRIEPGASIKSGSIILGDSYIGESAIVGPNSELVNVCLKKSARVIHSVAYDSVIGTGASVGPFAHLRMHTVIGEYDRIGNFVEIKNSYLGKKTNVSHLTYLGDTSCGNGVNFGCGVITVNYDGQKKNKTEIGDNVFIGCNSNLIAPLRIENNCYIAAGSTITDSLQQNDFAIARAPQITKKGYSSKYGYKKI